MIDWKQSADLHNWNIDECKNFFLKYPGSHRKIVRICDNCNDIKILEFRGYSDICRKCSYSSRIKIICNQCGATIYRIKSGIRNHNFCNINCKAKWQSENLNKENHPGWKGGDIKLICDWCGSIIYKKRTQIYNHNFCNQDCKAKWQVRNLKGESNPFWDRHHTEESKRDMSATKQGLPHNVWVCFMTEQKYCSLFNTKFKEQIRNFYNRRCFLCGKTEKENGKRLSVHHVNYDKNCLCGLRCEFVPLCSSCHSKTNTNRKYWEDLIMCYLYPNRYFMIDI